jgi:two-component system, chemotaxis family, chemotaxis protein CheY
METKSHQPPSKAKNIFLAEDDIDDQEFLTEALQSLDDTINVHVENSGEKAISYLEGLPDGEAPCLIILDYNLPLVSGHQILENISASERYKDVTKVVWSTSNSSHYEQICLRSGASAYFVKPSDVAGIKQLAKKMLELCG